MNVCGVGGWGVGRGEKNINPRRPCLRAIDKIVLIIYKYE